MSLALRRVLYTAATTGAAFTPAALSGLELWLDARGFVSADGTAVSSWLDGSGNARHATQGAAGSRPTVQTASGRRVVRFDGTDDFLSVADASALDLTGDHAVYVVCKPSAVAAIQSLLAHYEQVGVYPGYGYSVDTGGYLFAFTDFTGGAEYEQLLATANQPVAQVDANWHLVGFEKASGTFRFRIDARPGRFRTMTAPDAAAAPLLLGIDSDGASAPFGGDMAEILIYSRVLTAAERRQIETYLVSRWGLTLAARMERSGASATVSDLFTNTNGTALATHNAAWSAVTASWEIQSNAARTTAIVDSALAVRETGLTDLEVSSTITTPALPGVGKQWDFGLLARYTDTSNYVYVRYLYDASNPEVEVWQIAAGVASLLYFGLVSETNTNELAAATNYELAMQVEGATVRAYHRGEFVGAGTTTVLTGTKAGMGVWAGAGEADSRALWTDFTVKALP